MWEMSGSSGWGYHEWDPCPYEKRHDRELASLSTTWGGTEKMAVHKPIGSHQTPDGPEP